MGDWSVRSSVPGNDEIAALARSVNEMAETLGIDIAKIIKMSDVRSEFLINVTHELKNTHCLNKWLHRNFTFRCF